MAFRQKTVVGTPVSFSLFTMYYAVRILNPGPPESQPMFRLRFSAIGLAVGATVVGIIAAAIATAERTGDPDPRVERVARQTTIALEKNAYSPSRELVFRIARVFPS